MVWGDRGDADRSRIRLGGSRDRDDAAHDRSHRDEIVTVG
jgi:hypothetical protein